MAKKWTDEKIIGSLNEIIEEIGYLPSWSKIPKDLYRAAQRNGGYNKYRFIVTGNYLRKPRGFWKDKNNVILELNKLISKLGRFPFQSDMNSDLDHAINRYYGGIAKIRNEMGYKGTRKSRNYWNEDSIIKEINEYINIYGEFPTRDDSLDTSLTQAIGNFGGPNYFKKLMELPISKKNSGYWNNFDNLKKEITQHFPDLIERNIFPTVTMLRNINKGIHRNIKYHGGVREVANKMNCKTKYFISTDGHYLDSSYELLFDEFLYRNNIPHETHGLICKEKSYRYDFKICDVYIEIWGYPKNGLDKRSISYNKKRKIKENLYKELDYKTVSIDGEIFNKSCDYIEAYFRDILKNINVVNFNNFQSYSVQNYRKYFGYWNEKNIILELKIVIDKTGEFPKQKWFLLNDKGSLLYGINRNGGLDKFREILDKEICQN